MKRFLLWVVGVILGVAVLLGAVMTVSYSFTGEGSRPAADTQFGGQALEVNGSCWQVPLLGGVFDKVFTSPETLTVQKLGVLYDAHPALALPDWASYTTLTIETDIGSIVFAGSASQYKDFLFPANGDYKAKLTVWRLPQDYLATQFEGGTTGAIRKNLGVEHPAKPTGWYSYSFRFTLQASAEVTLSTERLEQGGVAALSITGLTGETPPAVETDLGSVQCVRLGSGWRAYIPAPAGGVVVFAGDLALTGSTVVIDHGCGVRSYLYGLQELSVTRGQTVERGQAVGVLGEELTMDFKLGSKSVNPWPLFQTSGGLFWQEKG